MMKRKWYLLPLAASGFVVVAAMSTASDHEDVRQLRMQGDILPLEQIIQQLPEAERTRIVEVELEREDGRYVYEIEYLEEGGVVRESEFDATTGELLKTEIED